MVLTLVLSTITDSKENTKEPRGKKKGRTKSKGTAGSSSDKAVKKTSPDPVLWVNSVTPFGERDFIPEEDYERSIQDMVRQLKNSSELVGNKCEVNLRLWLSNRRSLSPWSYRINHDEHRIPMDVPEAQCLCSGCINPFTMQEDRTMSSIPIYTKIPVKRLLCDTTSASQKTKRKKKKCHREYKTVMENVAIGCTCIF
ncbi:interleukin-17B [Latimeria chalumnae]|uniref:Interleukin 17B n=1 Tax=Latimeria chalumnae TaxID=7897 RepID=M3XJ74_LATCH|nr:PREDICTED: interleukin-17B isoform X2 [Latimeria chalumnae]|eukprot:XP_014348649.1 PREDICTED: interleukin-17B isoform X2 [Latimeria chalumnae]